jgi:hypothetical protein
MNGHITFSDSAKPYILSVFDMGTDNKGIIIDIKTKEKVLTRNGEECHIDDFVGICKGFGIIKEGFENIVELSDYIKEQKKKEDEI